MWLPVLLICSDSGTMQDTRLTELSVGGLSVAHWGEANPGALTVVRFMDDTE